MAVPACNVAMNTPNVNSLRMLGSPEFLINPVIISATFPFRFTELVLKSVFRKYTAASFPGREND